MSGVKNAVKREEEKVLEMAEAMVITGYGRFFQGRGNACGAREPKIRVVTGKNFLGHFLPQAGL